MWPLYSKRGFRYKVSASRTWCATQRLTSFFSSVFKDIRTVLERCFGRQDFFENNKHSVLNLQRWVLLTLSGPSITIHYGMAVLAEKRPSYLQRNASLRRATDKKRWRLLIQNPIAFHSKRPWINFLPKRWIQLCECNVWTHDYDEQITEHFQVLEIWSSGSGSTFFSGCS